jgi:hypothetical protein
VPLWRGGGVEHAVEPAGVGADAGAIVANLTAVHPNGSGWLALSPAGVGAVGSVSNVNVASEPAVASMAIVPLSSRGLVVRGIVSTDVVIDVYGWFTGARAVPIHPPPTNVPPARPRVLVVGDSSFAGMRWSGTLDVLRGADFITDLQSCRRLIGVSCRGREGFAPQTAEQAVRSAGRGFDIVVVVTGYNDGSASFSRGFDAVVAAARHNGALRIVWATYREGTTYRSPGGLSYASVFAGHNAVLRAKLGSGANPDVVVADWWGYSAGQPQWFLDGVHFRPVGAVAAADWISRWVARVAGRPCPVWGSAPGGVCENPDLAGPPLHIWSLYRS